MTEVVEQVCDVCRSNPARYRQESTGKLWCRECYMDHARGLATLLLQPDYDKREVKMINKKRLEQYLIENIEDLAEEMVQIPEVESYLKAEIARRQKEAGHPASGNK